MRRERKVLELSPFVSGRAVHAGEEAHAVCLDPCRQAEVSGRLHSAGVAQLVGTLEKRQVIPKAFDGLRAIGEIHAGRDGSDSTHQPSMQAIQLGRPLHGYDDDSPVMRIPDRQVAELHSEWRRVRGGSGCDLDDLLQVGRIGEGSFHGDMGRQGRDGEARLLAYLGDFLANVLRHHDGDAVARVSESVRARRWSRQVTLRKLVSRPD